MTPDPITRAAQWLDAACGGKPIPSLLIVVGIDEGHLLDVLDKRGSSAKVLAIEPDRAMAGAFQSRRDLNTWRSSGRLRHLVHPDYSGADEAWRMFPNNANDCLLMVNPRLKEGSPEVAAAARTAQKILYGVRANAAARRQFAPRYLTNVIRNIPAIATGGDVRALTNAFQGIPAVIAAAGPSLDAAIPELQRMNGRGLLIAVDTALRPMLEAGITPQLVTALDPSLLNARHFQMLADCPDTWLVAESALDRSAAAPFDRRTFWLRIAKHHPWPWLNACGIEVGHIDVWGSVLTGAFQLACVAGCDPIIFVGADLAFTGGRPYCRGTTYEFDWAWSTSIGRSLEQAWQHHIDSTKPHASVDVHGRQTVSSGSLESFRDWIVSRARKSGRRVINATGDGILFGDGIEQGTLAGGLAADIRIPSLSMLASQRKRVGASDIAAQVARVRRMLDAGELSASPLAEWIEFSGDGFDRAGVDAALAQVEAELRGKRSASVTVYERLAETSVSRPVSTQLPEAMIRFRAALAGAEPGGRALAAADRAKLLFDALDLLDRIRHAVKERVQVELTDPASNKAEPAAASYKWGEDLRWSVETYEALLGAAWGIAVPRPQTFFDGPRLATDACMTLAVEWVRCASSFAQPSSASVEQLERITALGSIALDGSESEPAAVLTLTANTADASRSIDVPVYASPSAMARIWTGTVRRDCERIEVVVPITAEGIEVTIRLSSNQGARKETSSHASVIRPRWITDERLRNATVAYPIEDGVVCARLHATESFIVRDDGSIQLHNRWPRPTTSELPFGEGGAIAWDQGGTLPSGTLPSYVMYRRTPSDEVTIEELPFRPGIATWWNGRMYWASLGSDVRPGRELVSWAPGEAVRFEVDDLFLYDMHPEAGWLVLEPRFIGSDNKPARKRLHQGWRWRPADGLVSRELGPYGSSSARSRSNGWTATAYPESDLVRLEADNGQSLSMTVFYPYRLAWVGRSLLVSSIGCGLSLFEGLADAIG